MDRRQAIALGLAGASLVLAAAFGVLTFVCGAMEVQANEPGQPANAPHCVSAFHPFALVWAAFALVGLGTVWKGPAWVAIGLGAFGLALGVLAGLSAGFYGVGCGALLLAAGLVGRRPASPSGPAASVPK